MTGGTTWRDLCSGSCLCTTSYHLHRYSFKFRYQEDRSVSALKIRLDLKTSMNFCDWSKFRNSTNQWAEQAFESILRNRSSSSATFFIFPPMVSYRIARKCRWCIGHTTPPRVPSPDWYSTHENSLSGITNPHKI